MIVQCAGVSTVGVAYPKLVQTISFKEYGDGHQIYQTLDGYKKEHHNVIDSLSMKQI